MVAGRQPWPVILPVVSGLGGAVQAASDAGRLVTDLATVYVPFY